MSETRVEYMGQECQVSKAQRMYGALDTMREKLIRVRGELVEVMEGG